MKVRVEDQYTSVSIEDDTEDLDIHQFIDLMRRVAIALTYSENTWEQGIIEAGKKLRF